MTPSTKAVMLRELLLPPGAPSQVFMNSGADGADEPTETVCPLLPQLHTVRFLLHMRRESSFDSERELACKWLKLGCFSGIDRWRVCMCPRNVRQLNPVTGRCQGNETLAVGDAGQLEHVYVFLCLPIVN